MIRQPLVDLAAQHAEIGAAVLAEVERLFAAGTFIGGEPLQRFEREFAKLCQTAHCVGVGSGTDALHLALRAAGVGPGDEVITVPLTFVATAEAVVQCGARPVLVDVRPDTLVMDIGRLSAARTARTRAVLLVHLYGRLADVDAAQAWCRAHGVVLVEDAAQAHGARLGGRAAGSFGDAGAFSFYPSKNLGAAGEAGAVVTSRDDLAEQVRRLRDHGQAARYLHAVSGFNSRLDALQAAVLAVKLERLDRWNERRRALAGVYHERLAAVPGVTMPPRAADLESHVHHLFVVRVRDRDRVRQTLARHGIETGVHYPVPLHLQPAFRELGYAEGAFPAAEAAAREVLSLPLYPQLDGATVHRVCDALEAAL
ncbi:MAG TPA: DegT/DnrJ/EryC1/StrS family aminotransferase [Methylomirabilota bacterium]|nr:DegT/DnrJ/EryC1/StrS family aminotransferase [Methylomirabilota bacterium]